MGRKAPLGEAQRTLGARYPDGMYHLRVDDIVEGHTNTPPPRLSYNWKYTILDGPPGTQYQGKPMYENMMIGTEKDNDALDPETWKSRDWQTRGMHARDFVSRLDSCGVKLGDDVDEALATAKGKELVLTVGTVPDLKKDGQPNARAGESRFGRSYQVGKAPKAPPLQSRTTGALRPNGPQATQIDE